jgi:hypothetical protein
VAANLFVRPLLEQRLEEQHLSEVQRLREFPTTFIQGFQAMMQSAEATAQLEDDPAIPQHRVSDQTTESSTKPSTRAVIFDPGFTAFLTLDGAEL